MSGERNAKKDLAMCEGGIDHPDAIFIIEAREALPYYIREYLRLRGEVFDYRRALEATKPWYEQVGADLLELGINCGQYNWKQQLKTMVQSGLSGEVATALEHLERDVKRIECLVSGEGAGR